MSAVPEERKRVKKMGVAIGASVGVNLKVLKDKGGRVTILKLAITFAPAVVQTGPSTKGWGCGGKFHGKAEGIVCVCWS